MVIQLLIQNLMNSLNYQGGGNLENTCIATQINGMPFARTNGMHLLEMEIGADPLIRI